MTQLAEERGAGQDEAVARISHWIDGRSVPGESGRTGPVYNPATGRQAAAVDLASVEEMDRAVQAAKAALPAWRAVSLGRRAEIFFPLRQLGDEQRQDNGRLLAAQARKGPFR